jgi:homoaconitase/3-isopropylmalate dehydratase large subunit
MAEMNMTYRLAVLGIQTGICHVVGVERGLKQRGRLMALSRAEYPVRGRALSARRECGGCEDGTGIGS